MEDSARPIPFGNCVVLKPADLVPGSAWALADIIHRSGIPAGVFNLVMGPAADRRGPGEPCRWAAISFTGSTGVDAALPKPASKRQEGAAENGRQEPQIVPDDADLNQPWNRRRKAVLPTGQALHGIEPPPIVTDKIYPAFIEAPVGAHGPKSRSVTCNAAGTDMGPGGQLQGPAGEQDLSYVEIAKVDMLAWRPVALRAARHTAAAASRLLRRPRCSWTPKPVHAHQPRGSLRPCGQRDPRVKDYEEGPGGCPTTREFGLSAGIATTSPGHATHFWRHSQAGAWSWSTCPRRGVHYHAVWRSQWPSYGPREQGRYAQEFLHHGEDGL